MKKIFLYFLVVGLYLPVFAVQDTDFTMNGAVIKEKTAEKEVWLKDDGTVITVYSDRSEAVFPDKSKIIKHLNGRREVFSSNGSTVVVDEAKGIREYSGTTKQTISFVARTPFGEKIERVEKKVLKNPVLVRMIYIPEKSDELLYPATSEEKVELEIQTFFDSLYDSLRQKYINDVNAKNPLPAKAFDLEVSYCRYCKTGYCFGKDRQVIVDIVEEGKVVKTFNLEGMKLREKGSMKDFVRQIIERVSQ